MFELLFWCYNKNVMFMKYIIIVIVMFFLSGCNGIKNVDKSEFLNIKNDNIEVYDEIYLQDLLEMQVTDKNFQLLSDNYRIDTNTIGKKKYEVLKFFQTPPLLFSFVCTFLLAQSKIHMFLFYL